MSGSLCVSIIFLISVACSNFYGDEDLGDGYSIWVVGAYVEVVYGIDGYKIVDHVVDWQRDERFIYLISQRLEGADPQMISIEEYWLIDTRNTIHAHLYNSDYNSDSILKSNVTGPLDSIEFTAELQGLGRPYPF